jgi:hypothetical protein
MIATKPTAAANDRGVAGKKHIRRPPVIPRGMTERTTKVP